MSRRRSLQCGIELRQEELHRKGQNLPLRKRSNQIGEYLSTTERGKVEIGAEILLRIGREFVKSVEWLMTGKSGFSNVALLSDGQLPTLEDSRAGARIGCPCHIKSF
jgi:hypothetical protein